MKISTVVTGHREGILAGPSIASFGEAVAEAVAQGHAVERIVVLDRPDDLTRSMFERTSGQWDQIVVTDFGDPGLARNQGVAAGSGDYITFLDADDLWSYNWLTACIDMSQAVGLGVVLHSEMNVVFGAERYLWFHADSESKTFDPGYLMLSNYWDALAFCDRQIFLKHPFRKNDLPAGYGHEDWHWNLVTLADGYAHRPVPGTVHFKRRRRGSQLAVATEKDAVPWPPTPVQMDSLLARSRAAIRARSASSS